MNNQVQQQLLQRQKEAIDTFISVQGSLFSGFEKLVDLNLKAIKSAIADAADQTQQVAELKDPQEAASYVAAIAQPNAEKAVAYTQDVYAIMNEVSKELIKLTEEQVAESQKKMEEALEQFAKNAPTGSESAIALLKSSFATATSATLKATENATKAAAAAKPATKTAAK
ncbi:phasin family protein [Oligella urethralis]|uniref:phasin family protein n=1 Tax=Oligella urethralis TaxID=90245 RepID=UPI000DFC29FF|nr:phasin family protein [Oligella urethralis]SUA54834.1 phasin family protein [Oligella urethralis]